MNNYCLWLILGILYGVLNIFFYGIDQNNFLGTFLSSVPMWLVIPYFSAIKNSNRKSAVFSSMFALMGVFTGYHITRILKSGIFAVDLYDILWIIIGAVFGLIWGLIAYPVKNSNIKLLQRNLLPATFIAEALYEMKKSFVFRFPNNFNSLHIMLLATGVVLYFFINGKDFKSLKNCLAFVVISLVEFIGITAVYSILHSIL